MRGIERATAVAVVAAAAMIGASAGARADAAVDKLLNELVSTCGASPAVKQMRTHLSSRFVPLNKTPATAMPKGFEKAFGEPTAEQKEGYVAVHLPVVATVKGLKVTRLSFSIGVENGVDAQVVTFAAPLDAVEAKLGDTVRKIRAKGQEGIEVLLEPEGDTTDFVCDRSM